MDLHSFIRQSIDSRRRFFEERQELFARLTSQGQSPQILFIGCDDSRVIPEAVLNANPGDLFTLRNLANVIPPYGTGERAVGATLEYAVRHLHVKHVILCGHTDCGGIKALDYPLDQLGEPHLARWIEYTRPAQTQVDARGVSPENRHRAIVEQNVLLQLENLRGYDVVRQAQATGEITLHGWVYDLFTGRIGCWDVDTGRFVDEREL